MISDMNATSLFRVVPLPVPTLYMPSSLSIWLNIMFALYRNEETKKFSIIPWDYDATWGRNVNGKVMDHTFLPIDGFNTLTARILDVAHFRKRYSLILEDILETSFTPDHLEPRIAELHQLLRPCLPLDPFKKDKMESFDAEPDFIRSFIQNRSDYLRQCLVSFQSNV
ncbi:CotH kinase family protein [Brevibacillus sp. AY1]|uniref:CotH kinase family protein n=1 Tax=Brevibacillus sp. AY1 TaxID=2807621 RepID=UPI00245606F7|nr:CotH kinase family protein [Brevibacillus sp. AY1]MDH4617607.1 CotH kinase family protein [Brevibacillus sp. AY1]